VNDICSGFLDLNKGVPQSSILGPVIFNIFLNDIFHFVSNCDLYNYADDNTVNDFVLLNYDLKMCNLKYYVNWFLSVEYQ
jgi:hypothetical protein